MKSEYEQWRDELGGVKPPWWEAWILLGLFGFLVGLALGLALAAHRGLI